MAIDKPDHRQLARHLEERVLLEPADTVSALRLAVAARATGGPSVDPAYDALVRDIGDAGYRITDAQVAAAVAAAGSQRAAFEIIAAACVGAGLLRWKDGLAAIEEAVNAPHRD